MAILKCKMCGGSLELPGMKKRKNDIIAEINRLSQSII